MAVVSVSGARDDGAVNVVPAGVWRLVDRHQRLPVRRLHPKRVAGFLAGRKLKADFLTVWRRRQAQRRHIWGGRAGGRRVLYLAAFITSRSDPALKAMRQRLEAAGKPFKVAIIAIVRKLLTILDAMARDNKA